MLRSISRIGDRRSPVLRTGYVHEQNIPVPVDLPSQWAWRSRCHSVGKDRTRWEVGGTCEILLDNAGNNWQEWAIRMRLWMRSQDRCCISWTLSASLELPLPEAIAPRDYSRRKRTIGRLRQRPTAAAAAAALIQHVSLVPESLRTGGLGLVLTTFDLHTSSQLHDHMGAHFISDVLGATTGVCKRCVLQQ